MKARQGGIPRRPAKRFTLDYCEITLPTQAINRADAWQESLLRAFERWTVMRIGETEECMVGVRYILASNDLSENFGLAHDLVARTTVVTIPPLSERVADIPALFQFFLKKRCNEMGIRVKEVHKAVQAKHYEALCLNGFRKENARGLIKLVDRILREIAMGKKSSSPWRRPFADFAMETPFLLGCPHTKTNQSIDPGCRLKSQRKKRE